ncbi:MAG: glycosyltransferase family 2 protein [Beijerinckiaceae bacterium]|nr:glycosyltransferase family 2 protein [Beijerinckiaceae bacterium]
MKSESSTSSWKVSYSDVSVVMPAYNEEASIAALIKRVCALSDQIEVIVVDDGSADKTAEVAEAAGARVVRSPYNVGNGASVKRGILASERAVVLMMDSDGQHPPEEIPKLLAELGTYDMTVGARTAKSNTDPLRNVGNKLLIHVAQWISGRRILDLTSGFRAIKSAPLRDYLSLFPNRYSYPTTITLAMMLEGYFVTFVPMDSIGRREQGSSGLSPVRDFLRFIGIIGRIVVLFSPQRLFVPLGGALFAASIVLGMFQYWWTGGLQSASLALFISSINIACFGLLADQIAHLRRKRHQ